ncbi:dTDP-4-dehydrorhamnose 3,5-epimerase family protein [Oscillibacter sp.]|uniref:dTDP-4-dehydrorhamnose 3,5-epimerase family protein n=1 Tax=Oscillibacter sp. TaxID=1945593 RepID=UPI0028A18227|nr:dTDP-4-dehydrorhamnose 3,5-epimerase family protein [Oscillibacter sp.]
MKFYELKIHGAKVIEPDCHEDHLGWEETLYSKADYEDMGISDVFIQENYNFTYKSMCFKGIHYQKPPYAQATLIQCIQGAMLDFVVDLRSDSPTYGQWISVVLSEENRKIQYIPKGCGHASFSLTDNSRYKMKVSEFYEPSAHESISYLSNVLGITLPCKEILISDQDKNAKKFEELHFDTEEIFESRDEKNKEKRYLNDLSVRPFALKDIQVFSPKYYEDFRGYFTETFSERKFKEYEINTLFVQDKRVLTYSNGTIRGIYSQNTPHAQNLLFSCTQGAVQLFLIDLSKDSTSFKQWSSEVFSMQNHKQIMIPQGYGYAYVTLCDNCEVLIKSDEYDIPASRELLRFDDPEIGLKRFRKDGQ